MALKSIVNLVEMTPKKAAKYLEINIHNKRIDMNRVQDFMNLIVNEQWDYEKGTIELTPLGTVLNGYHRLKAIELSGETVKVKIRQYMLIG